MKHQVIHTDNAPKAIGPYSQAVKAGNMLFVSGQVPFVPETMEIVEAVSYTHLTLPTRDQV